MLAKMIRYNITIFVWHQSQWKIIPIGTELVRLRISFKACLASVVKACLLWVEDIAGTCWIQQSSVALVCKDKRLDLGAK
jgi:hypothetical protein